MAAATKDMCKHCFEVIEAGLQGAPASSTPAYPSSDVVGGIFVTLHKSDEAGRKELRGCIGSLSQISVDTGLGRFALSSAFKDSRFRPLVKEELPNIELSVSLLVQYEEAQHSYDWNVGTHGIIIEFSMQGRSYSGTYLPEVAPEQGWSQSEAVESLVRKAGYKGAVTKDLLQSMKTTRYQSSKCGLSYSEYLGMIKTA
jgi:AMME syndrome candidate gene 1 protein